MDSPSFVPIAPVLHSSLGILLDELLTKSQLLFFLAAMFLFGVLMMVLYRQDKKRDKEYFKGTWLIFGVLMLIVTILFLFVVSQK